MLLLHRVGAAILSRVPTDEGMVLQPVTVEPPQAIHIHEYQISSVIVHSASLLIGIEIPALII